MRFIFDLTEVQAADLTQYAFVVLPSEESGQRTEVVAAKLYGEIKYLSRQRPENR